MAKRTYGAKGKSYEIVEREDGWIDLLVCHKNKEIREYLSKHKNEPKYFLERQKQYAANNLTAKIWLAKVIDDYRFYFEGGQVKFVFK